MQEFCRDTMSTVIETLMQGRYEHPVQCWQCADTRTQLRDTRTQVHRHPDTAAPSVKCKTPGRTKFRPALEVLPRGGTVSWFVLTPSLGIILQRVCIHYHVINVYMLCALMAETSEKLAICVSFVTATIIAMWCGVSISSTNALVRGGRHTHRQFESG